MPKPNDSIIGLEQNKSLAVNSTYKAWNEPLEDSLDELIADNYINHIPDNPSETLDEFRARLQEFKSAFPDIRVNIEQKVAEGNFVATRTRVTGTHLGYFRGLEPTGKSFDVTGFAIDRHEDGKRVEGWALLDMATLLRHLGQHLPIDRPNLKTFSVSNEKVAE